ncbi:hypothetical protein [Streptomyces sp. NPDC053542]|uniref:hypothetical protein n=1 Tax=Streptomyces sp. NPDC053542 TaxID=3365710 RepID=UPI0037D2E8F1
MTWTAPSLHPLWTSVLRRLRPALLTVPSRTARPARVARPARTAGTAAAAGDADGGIGPSPVAVRRYADRTVIEVHRPIRPAAEPHLGRLLNAVIRPGSGDVVVDLRRVGRADGAAALVRLAQVLCAHHEVDCSVEYDASETTSARPSPSRALPDARAAPRRRPDTAAPKRPPYAEIAI